MINRQRLADALDVLEHLKDDVGLTHADIAEALQVTERTVSRWWTQKVAPSRRHLIELLGLQDNNEKEEG
jgi:DNA-binding transcriptional regulator YiaG